MYRELDDVVKRELSTSSRDRDDPLHKGLRVCYIFDGVIEATTMVFRM